MFDVFSTREVAIAIYILLLIVFLLSNKQTRSIAINMIGNALKKPIITVFLIIVGYGTIITLILSNFDFWKTIYLKDIIFWILFIGVPISFSAVENKEKDFFKSIVFRNFAFSALVEFVFGTFTLHFVVELILQPIVFLLTAVQIKTMHDDENKQVNNICNWLLSIIGFVIIGLTIEEIVIQIRELNKFDLLISFLTPIVYSFVFVPLAYIIAVYAKYEDIFCMFWFNDRTTEKAIAKSRRKQAIKTCGLSYKKQKQFKKYCAIELTVNSTETDFERVIKDFKGEKWNSKHFI